MKTINFVLCGCGKRGSSLTKDVISKIDGVNIIGV